MVADDELQRILAAQPLLRMQQFARQLGWKGLRLRHHRFRDDESGQRPINPVVLWYETTDWKFGLQINPCPQGQNQQFEATVQASRYRIWTVGWHHFELLETNASLEQEAARLCPWLLRRQFKDRAWRKRLLGFHPEFATFCPNLRGLPSSPFCKDSGGC